MVTPLTPGLYNSSSTLGGLPTLTQNERRQESAKGFSCVLYHCGLKQGSSENKVSDRELV